MAFLTSEAPPLPPTLDTFLIGAAAMAGVSSNSLLLLTANSSIMVEVVAAF